MSRVGPPSSSSSGARFRRPLSSMESNCSEEAESSQLQQHAPDSKKQVKSSKFGEIISALSNFSIQYNLGVIAPALLLLDHGKVSSQADNPALYPRTASADSLLKSAVFIGAILGQCSMGFIGEALCGSLNLAMVFTNCIALVGTLGSTCAPLLGAGKDQNADRVYTTLAVFRAILGFGVGGKYPLGSAIRAAAAESDSGYKRKHRAKEVAKGFFWQTPGAIMPFIVQLVLLLAIGDENSGVGSKFVASTNKQYVILVGLGALPSMTMIALSWRELAATTSTVYETPGNKCRLSLCQGQRSGYNKIDDSKGHSDGPTVEDCGSGKKTEHLHKLVGTGVSWALYDFVYYGTAFNQPEILAKVLGDGAGLVGVCWRDALVAMMGIPGVVLAIYMMEEPIGGPKPLQGWGFVAIGVASLLLLCFYASEDLMGPTFSHWGGFLSCALLIFSLNWGCNVSTYVLPMEVFPKDVRSSLHGVSAGMGKVGALLGSVIFTQLNSISVSLTFVACIIACCLGVLVTWRFIEPPYRNTFYADHSQNDPSRQAPISSEMVVFSRGELI